MRHSLFHLFSRPGFLINNDSCQTAVIATDIIISWINAGLSARIEAVVRSSTNWLPLDVKNSVPESREVEITEIKNKKAEPDCRDSHTSTSTRSALSTCVPSFRYHYPGTWFILTLMCLLLLSHINSFVSSV